MTANTTDAVLLHIAGQNAKEFITWLMGQSIPFELRFFKDAEVFSALLRDSESFEERTGRLPAGQRVKTPIYEAIEKVYQKYVENVTIATPAMSVVAREAGLGAHTFKAKFRLLYQKSFIQAHMEKRMQHAAGLLRQGYSCYEVSRMVGYGEKSAIKFNRMFRRHYGMTPKKYQMENRYTPNP